MEAPNGIESWVETHYEIVQAITIEWMKDETAERMEELHTQNQERRACKRRPLEKIVVSTSDPESACGRDKLSVFRPEVLTDSNYQADEPVEPENN